MRSTPSSAHPRHWLTCCAGECLWTCVAALASIGLLAVFVLVFEARLDIDALRQSFFAPVNVVRLVVLTACLALWGYIARIIRTTPSEHDRSTERVRALHTGSTHAH